MVLGYQRCWVNLWQLDSNCGGKLEQSDKDNPRPHAPGGPMIKRIFLMAFFCAISIGLAGVLQPLNTHAASNNNLIYDGVFDKTSSMSAAQIDAWLNGFPSSCI